MTDNQSVDEDSGATAVEQSATDECDLLISEDKRHLKCKHPSSGESGNRFIGKLLLFFGTHSSSRPSSPSKSSPFTIDYDNQCAESNDTIYSYLANDSTGDELPETEVRFQESWPTVDRLKQRIPGSRSVGRKLCNILISSCLCFISLVIFAFLIGEIIILTERESSLNISHEIEHHQLKIEPHQSEVDTQSRWIVSSPKCHIPQMDPWQKSIIDYVEVKEPVNCTQIAQANGYNRSSFTYARSNRLHLTEDALEKGDCCFRKIVRAVDTDSEVSFSETCIPINATEIRVPFESIKVECPLQNYTNVHSFMVHNAEEDKSLEERLKKRLIKDDYFNVIMLGMDTISRLNGYRQLNKTLELLRSKFQTIEFLGYNKVGENTFPNLIPLLTGLKSEQLSETRCWLTKNYTDESERLQDDHLDECKFLWNFFGDLGYRTYYSEDWPKASTFNYLKSGFRREPTNFYGRPAAIARDKLLLPPVNMGCTSCLLDRPLVEVDLNSLKEFIREFHNKPYFAFHWVNCPQHDDLNGASRVDHIVRKFFKDIHKITQNERTFVIFLSDHGYRWNDFISTRIGHYEASLPMLTIAPPRKFIEKYPDLYANLKSHTRTLLTPFDMFKTMMDIRKLSMVPSETKMPKQAGKQKRATIVTAGPSKAVVEQPISGGNATTQAPSAPTNETTPTATTTTAEPNAASTTRPPVVLTGLNFRQSFRVLSLLDRHNSSELDRSCIEAGIPDSFCVCHEFEKINLSKMDVLGASYYLVYVHLYSRLQNRDDLCDLLDLDEIADAEVFDYKSMNQSKPTGKRKKRDSQPVDIKLAGEPLDTTTTPLPVESVIDEHLYLPTREYNIRVMTTPGGGLFQEVVRFYGFDLKLCNQAVKNASLTVNDITKNHADKHRSVMMLNEVCKFSIHSDSISRLNLYRDQSKCVESDIELKKVCYCKSS